MPARQPSLSRNSGFVHLSDGGSNSNMNNHDPDVIPLTTVRSNASTGARKPAMAASNSFETAPSEKARSQSAFHRGRRQKPKDQTLGRKGTGDSTDEKTRLNFMGRVYNKIMGFSVVSQYLIYIVPVAIILAVPLVVLPLTDTMGDPRVGKGGPPLFQFFLWIEITWCTIWLAKLVAWFLPKLFMFFCGIVSSGTRKYATVLANLNHPLSLFFWALAVWMTFKHLIHQRHRVAWTGTMDTIFGALFVSSAVFLGEKAIVQLIGVSYHQRSFANRIKESKRDVHLIGLLYDASRTLFPMYCHEFAEEDYVINDTIEAMLGKKSGTATPMRLIGDVSRIGGKVTSAFGNIASEITGKNVFNPNAAHSVVIEALEKLRSSEALARRIWMSFVVEGNENLYPEDVAEVLGPAYKEEAEEAFNAIDSDQNGDISLDEMIRKVVEVGKERKAIGEGMKDIGQALGAFDQVLLFVVLLIVIFIFLAFFRSSAIEVIASAGTTLLSLSFIFAVTCQEFLGSCIFLFVKHPYDVGDRVYINDVQLIVERISLLYSVFTRTDTKQVTQIPNIQLNNYWVDNVSRSKAMYECFEVDVSYDTPFEDIELLRAEMEKFVRAPDNSRDFLPDFSIGIGGVGSLDKLTLKISILHKSNWHNDMVRASRRSKFMCALALALKKIPIYGPGGGGDALGGPANPTYSVAVTDDWASKARDDSAKAKEDGRMVPAAAMQHPGSEEAAISDINSRPPVQEMAAAGQWDNRTLGDDEGQRTRDIETVRSDLLKRASTRGRRRAGEGIPSLSSGINEVSPISPTYSTRHMFDEEAQTGHPTGLRPSASVRSVRSTRAPGGFTQTQTQGGSSLFPPGAQSGPPPPPSGQR